MREHSQHWRHGFAGSCLEHILSPSATWRAIRNLAIATRLAQLLPFVSRRDAGVDVDRLAGRGCLGRA